MNLLTLFTPLIEALLAFVANTGKAMLPEVEQDVKSVILTAFEITASYVTLQSSPEETKDSFAILVDRIRAQGDTLIGKLEVKSEQLPAEIIAGLTSSLGAIPGALLKLIP